jgi:putative DNA primase/helicase
MPALVAVDPVTAKTETTRQPTHAQHLQRQDRGHMHDHHDKSARPEPSTSAADKPQRPEPRCLTAALKYATHPQRPLFVICAPPGEKKSYFKKEFDPFHREWGMTKNPDTIREYWRKRPKGNVGIVTGKINHLFVIEVDTKEGHPDLFEDGQLVLDRLIAQHGGEWPETLMARSPSGSTHYYFTWPHERGDDITTLSRSGQLGQIATPGIDIKANGGMVLAPPSVRPEDKGGGSYHWISAEGVGINAAPQWLLDLVIEKREPHQPGEPEAPIEKIEAALELLPNAGLNPKWEIETKTGKIIIFKDWDGYNTICMAIYRATGGSERGKKACKKWSAKNIDKHNDAYVDYAWDVRFVDCPPDKVGAGTIFAMLNYLSSNWSAVWDDEHLEIVEAFHAGAADDDDSDDQDDSAAGAAADNDAVLLLSARNHFGRARRLRDRFRPYLLHYRDDFKDFDGGAYQNIEDGAIKSDVWKWLDKAKVKHKAKDKSVIGPFLPNRNSVDETIAALKALVRLDSNIEPPCWLNGRSDLPADQLIAFPNGLLDLRDNRLHPIDPAFFSTASLGFDYVAHAPKPTQWLLFLNQIFADEEEQIELLQEIFGYLLTTDVSLEKAFLLLGPKRSGKGTMMGVLRLLLAVTAVIGPSLRSLGGDFGLEPLIGKQLAIIDDLREVAAKDQGIIIENILKITGRGIFTIGRKYKAAWTGTLPIKLVIISNVMPKFGDDSAALASRFISLTTRVSFLGREDPNLLRDKLTPELLGVFHWALEGLRRLRARGYFVETDTSKEAGDRLANLGSPARAYIAEDCVLDPDAHVEKRVLYEDWQLYAKENDLFPGTLDKFCEAIYAATGGAVRSGRPMINGKQVHCCMGIRLRVPADDKDNAYSKYAETQAKSSNLSRRSRRF